LLESAGSSYHIEECANELNLHNSIFPMYLKVSKILKTNNKMTTSFKNKMSIFLFSLQAWEKKYYYLQIFNT